jgi:hypothetical protein
MRNVLDKGCRENKNTFYIQCLFPENRTVYEIMSKNIVKTEWPQMTSQYGAYALRAGLARLHVLMRMHTPVRLGTHMHARMRKHAHTGQYVILNAFPQQQRFRKRASMLRYTYIACIVIFLNSLCIKQKRNDLLDIFQVPESVVYLCYSYALLSAKQISIECT